MTPIKLAGLSILIIVFSQNTLTLGEKFLAAEIGKGGGLKTFDKRINNFRVPVEMPYDPNFWPARGRRSRRDPDKADPNENNYLAVDADLLFRRCGLRCLDVSKIQGEDLADRKPGPLDFESVPPINSYDELLVGGEKTKSDCYGNETPFKTAEDSKRKVSAPLGTNPLMSPKRYIELWPKRQKLMALPEIISYGKEVYWSPENIYGGKKKKEDVFWVTRGKKNFSKK